jgi:hypothetical protein
MRSVIIGLTLLSGVANVVIFILAMAALDRRGYKTSMLLARIFTFRYLTDYKEATQKETGKPGPLYGLWILTINLALVFAIAAALYPKG